MFKNHPKGLVAAALANMGERFGFYTMMAILVLFLQTKFNLEDQDVGLIYSVFYAGIYLLALAGGVIADLTKKYKATILVGLVLMALGYVILAIPSDTPIPAENYTLTLVVTLTALFIIAFGNGLFKGNLQALVGQMYDNEKYSKMRDSGFSLFYMFINVGAIFAPLFAVGIRNMWLESKGFVYNQLMPDLANKVVAGAPVDQRFIDSALASGYTGSDYFGFAQQYLNVFTEGFHYAFSAAIVAMLISLVVYVINAKSFPDPAQKVIASEEGEENSAPISAEVAADTLQRIYALLAVFGVVIFFWFSFHQNGLTLTFFARDYINLSSFVVDLGFVKLAGAELFQSFNPLFVVLLTPVVLGVFGWLRSKGMEPSTPRKIAIGMGIAALAFVVMVAGSLNLPSRELAEVEGYVPSVTPALLIITYFILTIAELFISPLGLSFVSKVAPPSLQGIMQGLWLCATAVGNQLLFIGAIFYDTIPLATTWSIFVVACLISMVTMLFMVKWLERVAK